MFVNGFGLSNGWAELALKQPPPLLPISLMDFLRGHRAADDGLVAPDSVVIVW